MTVRVRMFAGLRHLVDDQELEVPLPAGATVGVLKDALVERYPVLDGFLSTLVFAIDEEVQPPERVLRDGELVEVIPPIAGG